MLKILVVDDEPAVLRLVADSLLARGYDVQATSSPAQALALVTAGASFDLMCPMSSCRGYAGLSSLEGSSRYAPELPPF